MQATGQIPSVEVHNLRNSWLLPQLGCIGYVDSLTRGLLLEDPDNVYTILDVCGELAGSSEQAFEARVVV